MLKRRNIAGLGCLVAVFAGAAQAASLQWSKVPTAAQDERACIAFARKVAKEKLQNVRESAVEIAGVREKARASMICIGRGGNQKAVGIVMVTGDDDAAARQLRDDLANALKAVKTAD